MKNSSLSTNNVTLITAIYLNLSCKDNLALNIKQGCWWTIKSLIVFISFRFLYLLFSMLSRRSCVLRDIFFPTYSYIFFQWKIFQIRLQDYRFFIPPNFPPNENRPPRRSDKNPLWGFRHSRFDEAKLRVSRI